MKQRLVTKDTCNCTLTMKALYYLLSSSQGFPISKCKFPSSKPEPNWHTVARLIAFVSNIFPMQEEAQFSDGNYTYFSHPQLMANGSFYFITIFTGDGPLVNLSTLSSYIGFVSSVLFGHELQPCLQHLENKMASAINNSTYKDTIQGDFADLDGDFENGLSELHDIFPSLIDGLAAFEEHFIRDLLMSERVFYHVWFLAVADYFHNSVLTSQACSSELNVVYHVTKDQRLSSLLTAHLNQNCHNEILIEDLKSALLEYTRSSVSCSLYSADQNNAKFNPFADMNCRPQRSHMLNTSSSNFPSATLLNSYGEVMAGCFYAVSEFIYEDSSLLMVCHIPNNMIIESQLKPILFGNWTAESDCKLFPVTALPPDLCDAWETSLSRLHRAFFMSHSNKDVKSSAEFYADIVLPDSITPNKDAKEASMTADKSTANSGSASTSVDHVEYFPQPPGLAVCGVAPISASKSVTRPGRTYA